MISEKSNIEGKSSMKEYFHSKSPKIYR